MHYIAILFLIIVVIFCYQNKIKIEIPSFFRKGFFANKGKFGVYCYCGKQGNGKTYSTVKFLKNNQNYTIYSNIHLENIDYTPYSGIDELLKIKTKNCIIVFDEIFSEITKSTKMSKEILSFLSQMRKRQVIFITTAQEWLEINITLRRYVRFQIDCTIITPPLLSSILIERYRDGDQLKWSNEENEYIAPIIATKISKLNKIIADCYDTWETVGSSTAPVDDPIAAQKFKKLKIR